MLFKPLMGANRELRRGDANDCKKANDIIVEAADAGDADAMFVKFKW